jgi:hypothetical protein
MATVPVVVNNIPGVGALFQWVDMPHGDDGEPVQIYAYGNRTIQALGSSQDHLLLEGNNDPETMAWSIMVGYVQGTVAYMNLINPGVKANGSPSASGAFYADPRYIRPRIAGLSGSYYVPVTVSIWCVEQN